MTTGSRRVSGGRRTWVLGWQSLLGLAAGFGLVLLVVYAAGANPTPGSFGVAIAAGCLLALAAGMLGAIAGFLFGLPRAAKPAGSESATPLSPPGPAALAATAAGATPGRSPASPPAAKSRYGVNTNLEDISDWLTKILIGASLTQLGALVALFHRVDKFIAPALGSGSQAMEVGAATMIASATMGFLVTYLWARTGLEKELTEADVAADAAASHALARASAIVLSRELSDQLDPLRTKQQGLATGSPDLLPPQAAADLAYVDAVQSKLALNATAVSDPELLQAVERANALLVASSNT